MNNLPYTVHARVRAACAVDTQRLIGHTGECCLQRLLHRRDIEVGLRLPAIKQATVVFYPAGDPTAGWQRVR